MDTFDASLLAEDTSPAIFSPETKLVKASFIQDEANRNDLENKVLALKILSCTLGSSSTSMPRINVSSFYGTKRQKIASSMKPYNRFWHFADLANPPHCVTLATRTSTDSAQLVKNTRGATFVGSNVFIYEPNLSQHTIGDTLPIITMSNASLYPFKNDWSPPDMENKMKMPTQTGEMNYFILSEKKVSLKRVCIASDPSCSGVQCDRQKPKGECTCFHVTSTRSIVMQFDVEFPVPKQLVSAGTNTVFQFRSLRTSKLFFKDFDNYATSTTPDQDLQNMHTHRPKVRSMVDHINGKGGWTIVGWYKLGKTSDAANEAENIDNSQVTLHLSYLYPSKPDNMLGKAPYEGLRITADDLPPATAGTTNTSANTPANTTTSVTT
jgi:hypothetical protein